MTKSVLSVIIISCLLACGQADQKPVLNLKDVIPLAHSDNDKTNDTITKEVNYGFNKLLARDLGIQIEHIHIVEESMLPDRFRPKNIEKLCLKTVRDSINLYQWIFNDSIQTFNAFYNWMDCFGKSCKSIKIGQKTHLLDVNILIFVNDTSINYITSGNSLKMDIWRMYFEKNNAVLNWKFVINQSKKYKAKWFRVEQGQIIKMDSFYQK